MDHDAVRAACPHWKKKAFIIRFHAKVFNLVTAFIRMRQNMQVCGGSIAIEYIIKSDYDLAITRSTN